MVRVLTDPVTTWTLTTVLLGSTGLHVVLAVRSHQVMRRVNQGFHSLMNLIMAALLWDLGTSTALAQIIFLAGAALWFLIQAVAHPEFKVLYNGAQARLKSLYHSTTMAGGSLMIAMMCPSTTGPEDTSEGGTGLSHRHHITGSVPQNPATAIVEGSSTVAILMTILFGVGAVLFIVFSLRRQPSDLQQAALARRPFRLDFALEAVGSAAMTLMFATMTA